LSACARRCHCPAFRHQRSVAASLRVAARLQLDSRLQHVAWLQLFACLWLVAWLQRAALLVSLPVSPSPRALRPCRRTPRETSSLGRADLPELVLGICVGVGVGAALGLGLGVQELTVVVVSLLLRLLSLLPCWSAAARLAELFSWGPVGGGGGWQFVLRGCAGRLGGGGRGRSGGGGGASRERHVVVIRFRGSSRRLHRGLRRGLPVRVRWLPRSRIPRGIAEFAREERGLCTNMLARAEAALPRVVCSRFACRVCSRFDCRVCSRRSR